MAFQLHKQGVPAVTIKKCGKGYLITTELKGYLDIIKSITTINSINIKYATPNWETQTKGVIKISPDIDEQDLQLCVQKANEYNRQQIITNAQRIKKNQQNTNSVIITFKTTQLPERIDFAGFKNIRVEHLLKKPTQCTKCFSYQHSTQSCKERQHCTKCSASNHTYDKCRARLYCLFCEERGHSPLSNSCPHKQSKIQSLNKHIYKVNPKPTTQKVHKLNVTFNPPNSSSPKPNQQKTNNNTQHHQSTTARHMEVLRNVEKNQY